MLSTSASNDLAVLIDRLIAAENILARENLVQQVKELRERSVLVAMADAVNRMAREDLRRAESLAEAICWVAERSGDLFSRARTRRASGNLQVLRGKYVDAIQTFQTCAEQFATIGEEIEVAATLSTSLLPLMYLSRYSEALERARQAREIAERRQDNLLLARLDINVGNILHRQDRFSEAILHYDRSLATLDRLGEKRDCVIAWLDLAVCHIAVNDFFRAEDAYKKARELALSENMTSIVAEADYNIAYLYYRRGDYSQAMQLYQQTRQYCQRVADHYMSALCDLDQAEMYLDLHLNREGTQLAQQALDAFESMDMGYEAAKAVVWLGIGAHQNRQPFEALDVFTKARQRMEHQQNAVWVALLDFYRAIILKQEGRFNEALHSCIAAHSFLSTFSRSGKVIQVQLLRASLHLALDEVHEAGICCASAMESARRLRSPFLLTQGCAIRGQIEETNGSASAAISSYEEALQWLEKSPVRPQGEESKLSLSKNRLELYEALVSLIASAPSAEHTPDAVFHLIEKAKARELSELLAFRANVVPAPSGSRSSLVERVRTLRSELNWYHSEMDAADFRTTENSAQQARDTRTRIENLEKDLTSTLSQLRPTDEEFLVLQDATTIPLSQTQEVIHQDEVILEFYEARGLFHACVVGTDSLRIVPTARRETVRDMLQSLRSQFARQMRRDNQLPQFPVPLAAGLESNLAALYRELIQPVREHIEGHRLIIVPHGALHHLPFHALFDGTRYLGENHVVSYAGSASQYYLSSRKQVNGHDRDLIFLGENFDQQASMRDRIRSLLPGARKFPGETSNIETLEKHGPQSRFIHVESRLQLRQDNPLFSKFTVGQTEVSILDTYNLHLPCSLLGLSGTGSRIDPAGSGSEIYALAQGLEYAGVQTLLLPLWNVTGEPLVQFLEYFYNRVSSEPDKPLAFQQTVSAMKERFGHPYYWAPFVLRGKTGRLVINKPN